MSKLAILTIIAIISLGVTVSGQMQSTSAGSGWGFLNPFRLSSKDGIVELYKAEESRGYVDCFPLPCSKEVYDRIVAAQIDPIRRKVENFKEKFQTLNNIVLIDGPRMEEKGALLYFDSSLDVTKVFIDAYQANNPKVDSNAIPRLGPSDIAGVNINSAFQGDVRLSCFRSMNVNEYASISKMCDPVRSRIERFAIDRKIRLLVELGNGLPEELNGWQMKDLTKNLSIYLNRK
jgi:hypothetical protein